MSVPTFIQACLLFWIAALAYGVISDYGVEITQVDDTSTTLSVGQTQDLKLTLSFTPSASTDGVHVEILTSIISTVFAMGEISDATTGNQLSITNSNFFNDRVAHMPLTADSEDGIRYHSRLVFDLGTVTSTGAGSVDADNQISIPFTIVAVSTGDDGGQGWAGAGMEYNNGDFVWVTELGYTVTEASGTFADPSISISDLPSVEIGELATVDIIMSIANPVANVTVVAESDSLNIQKARIASAGSAYEYSMDLANLEMEQFEVCPQLTSLEWNIGSLVNKESQKASPDSSAYEVTVELTVQTMDIPASNTANLSVAVDLDGEVIYLNAITIDVNDSSSPSSFSNNLYFVNTPSSYGTVAPGRVAISHITLEILPNTNLEYVIDLDTVVKTGSKTALSLLSVYVLSKSTEILCDIPTEAMDLQATESVRDSGVFDSATVSFNVSNNGLPSGGNGNVVLELAMMMHPTEAIEDEIQELKVNINNQGVTSSDIIVGPPQPYPSTVNYTLVGAQVCTDTTYEVGSTFYFTLNVTTQRDVVAGPMLFEGPIPDNDTQAHFAFVSAEVQSRGANVPCASEGELDATITDWVNGSGEGDRGQVRFPLMCNIESVDDVAEDLLILKMGVRIKNLPELHGTEHNFGVGIQVNEIDLWVATTSLTIAAPQDLGSVKEVIGVDVPANEGPDTWPGNFVLQWSPDGQTFYDSYVGWEMASDEDTKTDHMLASPLVGRYFRLINECRPSYTIMPSSNDPQMRFFGDATKTEVLLGAMGLALDDDTSTAIDLPTKESTTTPQYFWVSADLAFFGRPEQNTSFTVVVTGHGISCDSSGGQVTKVTHPGSETSTHFGGKRRMCLLHSETGTAPVTCKYKCDCSELVTCKDFNLLMYFTGPSIPSIYDLADLKIE